MDLYFVWNIDNWYQINKKKKNLLRKFQSKMSHDYVVAAAQNWVFFLFLANSKHVKYNGFLYQTHPNSTSKGQKKKKTFMPLKLQNGRVTSLSIIYSWKRKYRMNVEYRYDSSMLNLVSTRKFPSGYVSFGSETNWKPFTSNISILTLFINLVSWQTENGRWGRCIISSHIEIYRTHIYTHTH